MVKIKKEAGRYTSTRIVSTGSKDEVLIYKDEGDNFSDKYGNPINKAIIFQWPQINQNKTSLENTYYTIKKNIIKPSTPNEKDFICVKHIPLDIMASVEYTGYGNTEQEALEDCIKTENKLSKLILSS